MDALDEQLAQLQLINNRSLSPRQNLLSAGIISTGGEGVSPGAQRQKPQLPPHQQQISSLHLHHQHHHPQQQQQQISPKKIGPAVPPKPNKKNSSQIDSITAISPSSSPSILKQIAVAAAAGATSPSIISTGSTRNSPSPIGSAQQKKSANNLHHVYSNMKMTLDNPAILEQQLEALEHHKRQLEKKGMLPLSSSAGGGAAPTATGGVINPSSSSSSSGPSKSPCSFTMIANNNNSKISVPLTAISGGGSGGGGGGSSGITTASVKNEPSSSSSNSVHVYSNISHNGKNLADKSGTSPATADIVYSNILHNSKTAKIREPFGVGGSDADAAPVDAITGRTQDNELVVYSNVGFGGNPTTICDELPPPPPIENITVPPPPLTIQNHSSLDYLNQTNEDELPPPPSPVSSSYSELRRATDNFPQLPSYPMQSYNIGGGSGGSGSSSIINHSGHNSQILDSGNHHHHLLHHHHHLQNPQQTYINTSYHNDYSTYGPSSQSTPNSSEYYGYGTLSQGSSTYESIYEPINPRPPSQLSSHSNYSLYTSYVNGPQSVGSGTPVGSGSTITLTGSNIAGSVGGGGGGGGGNIGGNGGGKLTNHKEAEVEALTDLLVHSMGPCTDVDTYGICVKCGERVVGENSGCTAMEQIYHITCFTCSQCQINLQGKPFYALEGKPYCEEDYLNTLEKCSVCMKPILERILRATGKPYHPQCFCCVVCGNSLDGIPFTVDATNQNYCIEDFHKKFAPRCCVCRQPIMPEPGQEETVRVVALDRSFHFECYKCEDCGLLLSSESEGRGCYPLDDHVLCKGCNAQRVQALTSRMTTEL